MRVQKTNKTKSGWQAYDDKGNRICTFVWIPLDYGFLGKDGNVVEGSICENCGKWDGPPLAKGVAKKYIRETTEFLKTLANERVNVKLP